MKSAPARAALLALCTALWTSSARAADEPVAVSYGSPWLFWMGNAPPPRWPLVNPPESPGDALSLLPDPAVAVGYRFGPTTSTLRTEADRVVQLGNPAGGLVSEGAWWQGFHAPFSTYTTTSWAGALSGWQESRSDYRRKYGKPYARTALVYPGGPTAVGESGPSTLYLAHAFDIPDASRVYGLELRAQFKKGYRLFLNGALVRETRIPAGAGHSDYGFTPTLPTFIDFTLGKSGRWEDLFLEISPRLLRTGRNILSAVAYRGVDGGSPAAYFDAQLSLVGTYEWRKRPYLNTVSQQGVTIAWETSAPTSATITFTNDAGEIAREVVVQKPARFQQVRVDGLDAETRYTYRVTPTMAYGGRELAPFQSTVVTAPRAAAPFSFLFYGDSRTGTRVHRQLADLMLQDADAFNANLVVHVGDIVTRGYEWDLWQTNLFDPAGRFMSRVPMIAAIGNHEENAPQYFDYLDLPGNESWYRFEYGMADFFALNTNVPFGPESEQYRWADQALGSSTARWKIVLMHHPPFACAVDRKPGNSAAIKHLVPLFERHGVNLVLLGHDHLYGRSAKINGVTYLISGGGGSGLYDTKADSKMVKCVKKYNYVRLHVDRDRISWVAYDENGALIEEYGID